MNRHALKKLLKDRRALISPESHGLSRPTGRGRRAPGLSQGQVDELLGYADRTYQRLESGNYPHPPVDLLRDVARLYGMNEQEWISLCRYARGEDPPGPLYDTSGHALPAAWADAVAGITHAAYVTDASWNLVTCNDRFHALFESGKAPANTMRWMLLDGRDQLIEWDTAWAPLVMPQLQAALAQRPEDKVLRQIEADVLADPAARLLYEKGGASIHPDGDERPIRHAIEGPGWVTMCVAQPLAAPGSRCMILVFRSGPRRAGTRPRMLQAPGTRLDA
ncbi:MmyB family transcriptional regulator [Streptomyces cinerochromogenes]|uniref:MmyB family transcriptional regulator n=1 Tax=Streptomyces cinerochromogenes TaxID=66422 RepID=UPI00166FFACD|nr:helix-turn-helix domain-containing protein [Streptomyces cinerochromogenes]